MFVMNLRSHDFETSMREFLTSGYRFLCVNYPLMRRDTDATHYIAVQNRSGTPPRR